MVRQDTSGLKNLLRLNWFKILIILVFGYVVMQKDFSLNFNLNAPQEGEVEMQQRDHVNPSHKTSAKRKKKEKLTEAIPVKKAEPSKGTSFFKFFDNPFGGGTKKTITSYKTELDKIDESVKEAYLKRFAHVAINEQKKFDIPASVILANALLHSCSGKSNLAQQANNHFAVVCGSNWNHSSVESNGKCFRNYETAWMSFRNHSEYITSGKFEGLKSLGTSNYKAWAKALERNKFSTERNLSKSLIRIIEQYSLNDLDEK